MVVVKESEYISENMSASACSSLMRNLRKKPGSPILSGKVEGCTNLPEPRCLDSKISQDDLIHFLGLRSSSGIVIEASPQITAYDEGNKEAELESWLLIQCDVHD